MPLKGPDAHREARQQEGESRSEMLIGKDEGHVQLSVSLARTWSVSVGVVQGGSQGGSWACQLLSGSPICLSVGLLLFGREASVCFLKTIKSF